MTQPVPQNPLVWGVIASADQLPNVSGADIQVDFLRTGAVAYVPGSGLYVCTSSTEGAATWELVSTSGGGPTPLFTWDGSSMDQFDALQNIGTPVSPSIAAGSNPTGFSDVITLSLGNGTSAFDGAVRWVTDPVAFQSLRLRFIVAAVSVPVGETIRVGVTVAGDAAQTSGVSFYFDIDDIGAADFGILASANGTTYDLVAANAAPGISAWIVDATFNGQLRDVAGVPPNGAPALLGSVSIVGFTSGTALATPYSLSASDWDVAIGGYDTDRIGIYCQTPSGLTGTGSALIAMLGINTAGIGAP